MKRYTCSQHLASGLEYGGAEVTPSMCGFGSHLEPILSPLAQWDEGHTVLCGHFACGIEVIVAWETSYLSSDMTFNIAS